MNPHNRSFTFDTSHVTLGFSDFLNSYCTEEEKTFIFTVLLPFIVSQASKLPETLTQESSSFYNWFYTEFVSPSRVDKSIPKAPSVTLPTTSVAAESKTLKVPSLPHLLKFPLSSENTVTLGIQSPLFATTSLSITQKTALCLLSHLFLSLVPMDQPAPRILRMPNFHFLGYMERTHRFPASQSETHSIQKRGYRQTLAQKGMTDAQIENDEVVRSDFLLLTRESADSAANEATPTAHSRSH